MGYKLFLDDLREPPDDTWVVCRSTNGAIYHVRYCMAEMPEFMSLDHDLGGDDTAMVFLHKLYEYWDEFCGHNGDNIPDWTCHSANPVGRDNVNSFMSSWLRSAI